MKCQGKFGRKIRFQEFFSGKVGRQRGKTEILLPDMAGEAYFNCFPCGKNEKSGILHPYIL